MRRFLFVVNALIAVALVAAAIIFYLFFYRSLPQTSGTVQAGVRSPVRVDFDRLGVPHIHAHTLEDALFVQGYVTAEERMWQMDALRRQSAGDLSEVFGAVTLEADRESRRIRMRRIAEETYARLAPADKASMEAYARGVNAYIESHRGRYGIEFQLLGYDPRPWSVVDTLLVGLYMFRNLTDDWKSKLAKEQMLRGGDAEKVGYLFPNRSGAEFMPGGDVHPGSNAWAISGAHSATGKPLLSNDMHLEYSIPGIWYMTHLDAPGMNVSGLALPGTPGIIVGHNDRIAWGVTNLGFDVQDLYVEKIDLRTGQYTFQNKIEQARPEREVIAVKGRAPDEMTNWITRHGPVFLNENGRIMSLRWTAAEPGIRQFVFLDIDRARNWSEFRGALSTYGGPGQNFVYADVDGNIGYQATGKLPIRRNYFGDVPVDGSSGQYEWDGYIPFDELPEAFNPANGFVVSANQNPFPPDYKYHVTGIFETQYRSRQIFNMLAAAGNKVKSEDSLRIQKDVYSSLNKFVAQQVVQAYDKRGASERNFDGAIAMLRSWNGQMDKERVEPLITTLTYQYIRRAIADRASPGNGAAWTTKLSSSVTEKLLRERPSGWFSDYDGLVLRCFADAMDEGQRMQGRDPARWKWGRYMYLAVNHPIGSHLRLISGYFDIGPAPMSGGPLSVKQTTLILGPSQRMDVSTGDWDASLLNVPFGQSGHVASSHYRDEFDAYYYGKSFPMQYRKVAVKSTVMFVPADAGKAGKK